MVARCAPSPEKLKERTTMATIHPTAIIEAGIQAESFHPDCIIVDFSIGRTEALQICQNLRRNTEYAETILIALLPDDTVVVPH
jgi:DNA-binding response OmpR family regulator